MYAQMFPTIFHFERVVIMLHVPRGHPAGSCHETSDNLGIRLGALIAGRPDIRGQSGYVFRWGECWFEEVRDGGPGWSLQRDDKSALDFRVNLILDICRHRRRSGLPALMNSMQVSISDVQGEALDLRP